MTGLLIGTFVVVVLGLLGMRYGADSRGGHDWQRWAPRAELGYRRDHTVTADLRAVRQWVRLRGKRNRLGTRDAAEIARPVLRWTQSADGLRLRGECLPIAATSAVADRGTEKGSLTATH
jgi:hypothetical protein